MRGRKPKPLELIKLQGNPGKRAIPKNIPQPCKLYDIPTAPEYLNEIAKERWNYLAPKLVKCGLLTDIDIDTLEQCCVSLSVARMAAKKITENTLVLTMMNDDKTLKYAQKTPYLTVYTEALSIFDKYGAKLGLSPSDRVRLRGIGKKEDDDFDKFLKTGKAANA